jgi:anthranilate 1,2-dioxygenase (deaminating, decarboxylating) large subunit
MTVSARVHYLWNAKNDDPFGGPQDTQAGQAIHGNFATEYAVIPKVLRLGVNGYFFNQITKSEIDGVKQDAKEKVLAIGPGAMFSFSQDTHLFFNTYFESNVEARPKGEKYLLRLVHHF